MTRTPLEVFIRLQARMLNARLGFVPTKDMNSRVHILAYSHEAGGVPIGKMLCGLHEYNTPYEACPIDNRHHKPCSKCFVKAVSTEYRMQVKEEEAPGWL